MESVRQRVENMISLLTDSLVDVDKHRKGNFVAGGRIRKALQKVGSGCKEVRKQVQEERADR